MITLPILISVSLGGAAVFSIAVFLLARIEMRRAAGQAATKEEELSGTLAELQRKLEQVSSELQEIRNRNTPVQWSPEAGAFTLNRRGQILRLYRRGESIREIASALKVPTGEVKLVLKVHELSLTPAKNSENLLKLPAGAVDKTWEIRIRYTNA